MSGDSGSRHSFWSTLPGLLTGIAALITALVGVGALLLSGNDDNDDNEDRATSGSQQQPAGASTTSPDSSAASTPSARSPGQPVAGSAVLIPNDFLDVDQGVQGSSADGELNWSGSQFNLYGPRSAIIDGPTDLAGCEAALRTRTDGVLYGPPLTGGTSYVCMTTEEGGVALLRVEPPDVLTKQLTVAWTLWP